MPKVSVIIPVYNAAEYITACVNSLLVQTLPDMEFVFVDDHGHDNSIDIVKKQIANHARKSQFVFAETPQNSGPGIARNVGMQAAQGEYVAFLDSDDWVEADMYEQLYHEAQLHEADLCYCNAYMEQADKKVVLTTPIVPQGDFSVAAKRLFLQHFMGSCWTYIYRRHFLQTNGIVFPEGRSAEDSYFVSSCILAAQSVALVQKAMYHYIIHSTSLTQTADDTRYAQKVETFGRLLQKTASYPDFKLELEYIYIKKGFIVPLLNYICNAHKPSAQVLQKNYDLLQQRIPDFAQNSYFKHDVKTRVLTLLLHRMPHFSIFALPLLLRFSRYNAIV